MNEAPKPFRITFCKCWTGRFLSHIDMMRGWSRALRRTGLPIYFSQGFNPKPKISYLTPPLSVGQTSECETLDFRLEQDIMIQRLRDELSGKSPTGTVFIDVKPVSAKLSAITRLDYLLLLQDENCPLPDLDINFLATTGGQDIAGKPDPIAMDVVREHTLTFSKQHHPADFFDRAFRVSFLLGPDGGSPVKPFGEQLDSFGVVYHLHRIGFA